MTYAREILAARYFWFHLARAEVRARFRRSRLGILWALLQPLLLTLLMTFVFGSIFRVPMRDFAPFVFSGLLVWEYVFGAALVGCSALVGSAPYICQRRLPLAIYPLKAVLATLATFLVGTLGLLGWMTVTRPQLLGFAHCSLVLTVPVFLSIAWPLALITSFINAKYRDFQFLAGLLLQGLWYVSPVFLQPRIFQQAGIRWALEYNPVAHVLNLLRAPVLEGTLPGFGDYAWSLGLAACLWLVAAVVIRTGEREVVFYL